MASLKLLQTVGASILAFTSKGKVLVEPDSPPPAPGLIFKTVR
jgi:hypothetical protein